METEAGKNQMKEGGAVSAASASRAAQSASLSESEESAFRRWLRCLRPSAFPTSHVASSLGRAGTAAGRKEAAPPPLARSSMLSSNSAGRGRSFGRWEWLAVGSDGRRGGRAEAGRGREGREAGRHSAGARAGGRRDHSLALEMLSLVSSGEGERETLKRGQERTKDGGTFLILCCHGPATSMYCS